MAKKIPVKEIEQPDFFQKLSREIVVFVSRNKAKVFTAIGILVFLILIATGWYFYRLNYEKKAMALYAQANMKTMHDLSQGIDASEHMIKLYQDVISKYPSTNAALFSYYELGNIYFNMGDFDSSINSYKEFLKRVSPKSDLKILALIGIGYCYEAKKEYDNAMKFFQEAVNSENAYLFEGIIYRDIARVYEAIEDKEKALEFYQKALTVTTDTSMVYFIKRKIASLG